jgi:hypothetical protein
MTTINNQYNEVNSTPKYFVWANQTEANILLHPQRCRGFIANDTLALIFFDKDLNVGILRPNSGSSVIELTHGEPEAPASGICKMYINLDADLPYEKVNLKFALGEEPLQPCSIPLATQE